MKRSKNVKMSKTIINAVWMSREMILIPFAKSRAHKCDASRLYFFYDVHHIQHHNGGSYEFRNTCNAF